ncbi:MAG: CrcB family protein [Lewinellaceae bacterium]|nr:CrcB family protein [Saprospiraceae bacterium]MCB0545080.1 CrcB family protein [Saprospiraceae bacterium]MCB9307446.1 CrcB family protein [Lewinellaceae bacterium]MCB9355289.1 CrcB family protein [Lewinellaceae bacterium]
MQYFDSFFLVFIGGGLGSLVRFLIGLVLRGIENARIPWSTLVANGIACFVLGAVMGLHLSGQMTDERRLLLGTGFCGGLSTFSTFIAENLGLYHSGHTDLMLFNTAISLIVGLICLFLGLKMTL